MEIVTRDKWKALIAQANEGNAEAQWDLGYYYENGANDDTGKLISGVDILQAIHWYTAAAETGNADAQISLSNILSAGDTTQRDFKQAIYWGKRAVAQGYASAAFNLGTIYRDLKKPALAFRYYQQAAEMGDCSALLEVGLCKIFGFGTSQDFDEAIRCLNSVIACTGSASPRDRENAMYWLAILTLLKSGHNSRSVSSARRLLELANADDDHDQANDILNLIGKSQYLSD